MKTQKSRRARERERDVQWVRGRKIGVADDDDADV